MGGRMSCAAVCAVGLITARTAPASGQDAAAIAGELHHLDEARTDIDANGGRPLPR